jgi:hypothetical protein
MRIGFGGVVAAGAAAAALLFTSDTSEATVSRTCSPTKVAFIASTRRESQTNSTTFVNVPQASVSFVQGGSGRSCVLVHFSGHTFAEAANIKYHVHQGRA